MYPDEYKAASERTDEAERGLCRPFRRVTPEIETLGDMAAALGVPFFRNADEAQEADDAALVEWGAESEPYNHEEAQARKEAFHGID